MSTFIQLGFKQPVLTIYFFSFCCHTQGYYFQIRETRNRTTTTIFPFFSLTNSLENCLQISKKITNFVYKLHITRI
jgi:hypothetical protein